MATAIYIGLLLNVKEGLPDTGSFISFLGNLFFIFVIYDLLVLFALFRIGA